jgi:hypothetical protein
MNTAPASASRNRDNAAVSASGSVSISRISDLSIELMMCLAERHDLAHPLEFTLSQFILMQLQRYNEAQNKQQEQILIQIITAT